MNLEPTSALLEETMKAHLSDSAMAVSAPPLSTVSHRVLMAGRAMALRCVLISHARPFLRWAFDPFSHKPT